VRALLLQLTPASARGDPALTLVDVDADPLLQRRWD